MASGLVSEYNMPVECVSSSLPQLGMVVDLDFVAVVHRHPFFVRLHRNPDEHARIVVFIFHPEHHADDAIGNWSGSPIQQAHAAVGTD